MKRTRKGSSQGAQVSVIFPFLYVFLLPAGDIRVFFVGAEGSNFSSNERALKLHPHTSGKIEDVTVITEHSIHPWK